MTRLQRIQQRARASAERARVAQIVAEVKRAAVPTLTSRLPDGSLFYDRVQVDLRIQEPISPDLRRLLTSAEHTKGAWIWKEHGWTFFGHVVKTNYPEDLPAFGEQVAEAMKQAKREGKRLEIVRHK